MKLVMTLMARDEADIVDAHLAFHLNTGVDLVVATDHRSQDGTTEILEGYARDGYVQVIREEREPFDESGFMTRMARIAALDHNADWVIHSCADEFWWPRGRDLKDVLSAVPERYGVLGGVVRNFVLTSSDDGFFAERMTARLCAPAAINDPTSVFRPLRKVAHRGHASVTVGAGNHSVHADDLRLMRGWFPIEVLHFPVRSLEQYRRKSAVYRASEAERRRVYSTGGDGDGSAVASEGFQSLVLSDREVERGLGDGSLAIDTRLRDAFRELRAEAAADAFVRPATPGVSRLRFDPPTLVDDAAYAVEVAVLADADAVRAQRHLDELEQRVSALEHGFGPRLLRALRRTSRRTA